MLSLIRYAYLLIRNIAPPITTAANTIAKMIFHALYGLSPFTSPVLAFIRVMLNDVFSPAIFTNHRF